MRVFLSVKSRTFTEPLFTLVLVPLQVSVIVHCVPRTVAALLRPRERKRPRTLLNSVRRRLRAAVVGFADPPRGSFEHALRPPPVIDTVVSGFFFVCPSLNS